MVRSIQEMTEQNVLCIEDLVHEYNEKSLKLMNFINKYPTVAYCTEQNGELVPVVPDNVLIFPANRRVQ